MTASGLHIILTAARAVAPSDADAATGGVLMIRYLVSDAQSDDEEYLEQKKQNLHSKRSETPESKRSVAIKKLTACVLNLPES